MPNACADAVITDPPYGLSFMGRKWDYEVPSVAIWEQCLRVLKPGGHLLAFAGTRTQHRMCVNIEDAGFEIRDMIAWVYGSGFPKSQNVGKAIDKAAGAEREVIGVRDTLAGQGKTGAANYTPGARFVDITAPATPEAQQWDGWGTALKPAWECVTWAAKPMPAQGEQSKIISNLWKLEARLWLLSSASAAAQSSTSSQSEFDEALNIAQWTADDLTNTRDILNAQMDTSRCVSTANIALSIVSSWRNTLTEILSDGNTSITATELKTTTDWKTLSCCLLQITPENIIQACSQTGGFNANASTAGQIFNASLASLQSTLTLSAIEPVTWQELQRPQDATVRPALEPITVARKPFKGTVANNVLEHGTGAINIDGCRVGDDTGRWPANLIHDGSDEVTKLFPESNGGAYPKKTNKRHFYSGPIGGLEKESRVEMGSGSAARFFYTAKASKDDRDRGNSHPTVKPTDLMAYLCRLVTPPGGIVLDPFMGSGTTGKAALAEGFGFIGIERDPEYYAIAESRFNGAQIGLALAI